MTSYRLLATRILTTASLIAGSLVLAPTVAAAQSPILASDTMSREVTTGWGVSSSGATYAVTPAGAGSVAGGAAALTPSGPGRSAQAVLGAVSAGDVTSQIDVSLDALPRGSAQAYATHFVRSGADGAYAARMVVAPSGRALLQIGRVHGFSFEAERSSALPFNVAANSSVTMKIGVRGTDPSVSVSAKAWETASGTEPAGWLIDYSDANTNRMKSPGAIGALVYASASGPVVSTRFDNLASATWTDDTSTTPGEPVVDGAGTEQPSGVDTSYPGKRGNVGARAPGTLSYPVPAGAVFVAPNGSDKNSGTKSAPVATIGQALELVKDHGTVVLREGSYHQSVFVIPRTGVIIQPYPNEEVWLDGAETVNGWKKSGATWVREGWTSFFDSSPTYAKGKPDGTQPGWQWLDPARPMAAHPDQVWIDGTPLTQVGSRSAVTAGKFFVDEAAKQLVIGSDPSSRKVEASTLSKALTIRATDSTIRGIGVRRYATSVPEMGTVTADQPRITLSDVTIVDNATTGFYTWATSVKLQRVTVARNGLLGMGASTADNLVVDEMLSVGNNSQGFNRAPVSGALKVTRSRNVDVTNGSFINNAGQGPWFDESVYDVTFTDNDVWGGGGYGLVVELSEKAVIANNLVGGNAKAGVLIANSGNVSIWNNTIVKNATAPISITQDDRRAADTSLTGHDPRRPNPDPTVPWTVRNLVVANNVISAPSGDCLVCVRDWSREFTGTTMVSRADGNAYHRTSPTATAATVIWSNGAAGTAKYASFAEYVQATGRDKTSTLVDGSSILGGDQRLLPERATSLARNAAPIPTNVTAVSSLPASAPGVGMQNR